MSVFGPNQLEDLILGDSVATETTVADFIASSADKAIKLLGAKGGNVAANESFKVFQKTAGNAAKGLNYEFSDTIDPAKIKSIVAVSYAPEVQKSVTVSGFTGTVRDNSTYELFIRLYNDGGTLSAENFRIIPAHYVTEESGSTFADIITGLVDSLNYSQRLEGQDNFVFTSDVGTGTITVTGAEQEVVAGKIIGKQIEFDVTAKVKSNILDPISTSYPDLTITIDAENNPGIGTGKYITNLEWFVKGYGNEVYRETSYPANFDTQYYCLLYTSPSPRD